MATKAVASPASSAATDCL
jgi:hypothetical protein